MTFQEIITSSEGDGLSLRVKSFLAGAVPAIVALAALTGHPITGADDIANDVVTVIASFGAIVAAFVHVYAWARAFDNKANSLGAYAPGGRFAK